MRWTLLFIALIIATGGQVQAQTAGEPPTRRVRDAVYVGDRLWLRSDRSDLWFVTADGEYGQVAGGFIDAICARDRHLLALFDDQLAQTWRLRRWSVGGWSDEATIAYHKDEWLGAFECQMGRTTLVTNQRIVRLDPRGERSFPIFARGGRAGFTGAVHDTGEAVYYGLSAGEFRGGGLVRLDTVTGEEVMIDASQRNGWRHLALEPTTGLAPSHLHQGCVIAAMGQDHMTGWGNLSEVCRTAVRALFVKPFSGMEGVPARVIKSPYEDVGFSVPFYNLSAVGDVLWARGRDGAYRMDAKGVVTDLGRARLRRIGEFWVNFDNREAAFVHPATIDAPGPYEVLLVAPRQ